MKRRFRGESVNKVDAKGRVSVPAAFRRVLEEGDPDSTASAAATLVLIWGNSGGRCIEGFTVEAAAEIDDMIASLPRGPKRDLMARIFQTRSSYLQVDDTGRIILTADLRGKAGIDEEAMFVGMGDKFQIWTPAAFAEDEARLSEEVAAIGEDPMDMLYRLLDEARAGRPAPDAGAAS